MTRYHTAGLFILLAILWGSSFVATQAARSIFAASLLSAKSVDNILLRAFTISCRPLSNRPIIGGFPLKSALYPFSQQRRGNTTSFVELFRPSKL